MQMRQLFFKEGIGFSLRENFIIHTETTELAEPQSALRANTESCEAVLDGSETSVLFLRE